jgi:hypothetical protein
LTLGANKLPLIQGREVLQYETLEAAHIEEAGFEFDQTDFQELRGENGEVIENDLGVNVHSVSLTRVTPKATTIIETSLNPPISGSSLPGTFAQSDSDSDDDGDGDRESDDDGGEDSDNRHDSEPDEDGVAREGREIVVPFDIDRFRRLPFSP